jgi:hypothetical protein
MVKSLLYTAMLLLAARVGFSEEVIDCSYAAKATKADPFPELQEHKNCGTRKDGTIILYKNHLLRLSFDRYKIASVRIAGEHYYVKPDGAMLAVITFDNGADEFREGLTRSLVNNKVAYFNRKFRQVIGPKYDWGWPFENGKALVCSGCKPTPPDADGHRLMTGGNWGYINKRGEEIIPVKLTQAEVNEMKKSR